MGLIALICPSCGAKLDKLDDTRDFFFCPYCGIKSTFDKKGPDGPSEDTLMERAENYLSDGDFKGAEAYFNKVLDINPRSAAAYMGLVVSGNHVRDIDELEKKCMVDFSNNRNYSRALEYSVGNDHDRYARVNGPAHLYRTALYQHSVRTQSDLKEMEDGHRNLLQSITGRISSLETQIRYDDNSIQNQKQYISRQKGRHAGAVIKSLILPVFLVIVALAVAYVAMYIGLPWLLLVSALLLILALVRTIKAFTRNHYLAPRYEKKQLKSTVDNRSRHQAELNQLKQTYASTKVSADNEVARFKAAAGEELEKIKKDFARKYPGAVLGE